MSDGKMIDYLVERGGPTKGDIIWRKVRAKDKSGVIAIFKRELPKYRVLSTRFATDDGDIWDIMSRDRLER